MNKALSILIASTHERKPMFDNLMRFIKAQKTSEVEILASIDNGESSIGAKRNSLLKSATGKYVAFLDDDDMISPYYVSKILTAAKHDSDCIGITGIIITKDFGPRVFIHSLQYTSWFEKDEKYYRCPNHLNPIKREIALATGFPNISNQEDRHFSFNIQGKIKTETFIETPLYYYYPSSER